VIPWLVLLQASLTIATAGPMTAPEYMPLWLAQGEGYFAQENLTVSLVPVRAEAPAAEALGRGRADLAATSLEAALVLGASGPVPPKLVFGLTATPAVALLVPTARKEAVRSLNDLIGGIVGVPAPGTPAEFMLLALLTKAGIRVPQVTVKSYGERGLAGAIESAEVTAGMIGDPYATALVEEGKAVALVDLRHRDASKRWLGERGVYSALFARADARLGATELKSLARALLRAVALMQTASPEDLRAKLPAAAVGFPPQDFAMRVLGARETFLTDGEVTPEMLKASIALVRSRGPIPAKVKMPWTVDQLLLTGPLQEVLQSGRR
jgi:NitT/TauT family transport system substrate-binding protein